MHKTILPILLAFFELVASRFVVADVNILRQQHAQEMNRIGYCMQVYGNATCTNYSPSSSSYGRPSYDSPSDSSSYTPLSPEELAKINNWLRLNEARTPKHCTLLQTVCNAAGKAITTRCRPTRSTPRSDHWSNFTPLMPTATYRDTNWNIPDRPTNCYGRPFIGTANPTPKTRPHTTSTTRPQAKSALPK